MDDQGLTKEYACIYSPRMHFTASCLGDLDGKYRLLKTPDFAGPPAQRDPGKLVGDIGVALPRRQDGMGSVGLAHAPPPFPGSSSQRAR